MYGRGLKRLLPSAAILVAIFAVGTLAYCNEPFFCEPCDTEIHCPERDFNYFTFVCPANSTCYLNGHLACVSEECYGKEKASKGFECTTYGKFSDRSDCGKIITCFALYNGSYEVVEDECPLGLHFNEVEDICTTPDKTSCHKKLLHLDLNMTMAQDDAYECLKIGIFPDSDFEEYFYVCDIEDLNLKKLRMKCPDDMGFHPYESRCKLALI